MNGTGPHESICKLPTTTPSIDHRASRFRLALSIAKMVHDVIYNLLHEGHYRALRDLILAFCQGLLLACAQPNSTHVGVECAREQSMPERSHKRVLSHQT